ncbi:hypothetical protein [Halomonas kalidii]|uniref:Uncharacterized protein n=1 Tax=Halomonas kalidii TaxID=3043293 RepID=A0ABT6VIH2_9GAMM|nr:hypothetical protein [Halomonas kalidii]MDI5932556.1 hypothetical protein [Halomonas kalidii]
MPHRPPIDTGVSRSPLLRLLMLVTLGVIAVALWYLTSYSLRGGGEVRWVAPEAPCDLHVGACAATLDRGVSLAFEADVAGRIRALEPLPLVVTLEGLEAEAARVEFVGRDMDMGLHRFPLTRGADGVFRGEGQVTICTESVMPWRARVVVETARGSLGSWFDFDVERHTP